MNKLLLFGTALFIVSACQSGNAADQEKEKESPAATAAETAFALICKDITQPGDQTPHHEVYAVVGRDTFFVGDMEACAKIAPEDYAQYQIPEDAIDAVGGPLSDKVVQSAYIKKDGKGQFLAYLGTNFEYRAMIAFDYQAFQYEGEARPGAFVGRYLHSGQDNSYALFLGFSGKDITGQIFTLKGPLPEQEDSLMTAIFQNRPESLAPIEINFNVLSFSSPKGTGKFTQKGGKIEALVFDSWEGGKGLSFEKRE